MSEDTDAVPSEAFESWASEEWINNFHFNHCWAAWQAALAAVPVLSQEIIEARKAMLARLLDVQAIDRQSGGTTFYDREFESCRVRIFIAIDAEIERIAATPTGDDK